VSLVPADGAEYAALVHHPQPSICQSPYVQQRPATSLYRLPSTIGTSPRRRSLPAGYRIVVQSRRRRDVQSATRLQFVSNRTTAVPVLRRIVPTNNMADWENPSVVCSYAAGIMSLQSYNESLYVLIGNSTPIRAACPSPLSGPSSIQQLSASHDARRRCIRAYFRRHNRRQQPSHRRRRQPAFDNIRQR